MDRDLHLPIAEQIADGGPIHLVDYQSIECVDDLSRDHRTILDARAEFIATKNPALQARINTRIATEGVIYRRPEPAEDPEPAEELEPAGAPAEEMMLKWYGRLSVQAVIWSVFYEWWTAGQFAPHWPSFVFSLFLRVLLAALLGLALEWRIVWQALTGDAHNQI